MSTPRSRAWIVLLSSPVALAGVARGETVTVASVRLEIDTSVPFAIAEEPDGVALRASQMPTVWLHARQDACPTSSREHVLALPDGFRVLQPETAEPGPTWGTLCIDADELSLEVAVQPFEPRRYPAAAAYVHGVLASIAKWSRPPIEVAPGLSIERTRFGVLPRRGDQPNRLVHGDWIYEVSLDAATCMDRPTPAPGEYATCTELMDRALVLTLRPRPVEPPPPGDESPPPPQGGIQGTASVAVDGPGGSELRVDVTSPIGPAPPVAAAPPPVQPRPIVRPPEYDGLRDEIVTAAIRKYGSASLVDHDFRPAWGNEDLPLDRLPPGIWKIADHKDRIDLREVRSHSKVTIARTPCSQFWGSPPSGDRVPRPAFFPAAATAAIVDRATGWRAFGCYSLMGADVSISLELPREPDAATSRAFADALTPRVDSARYMFEVAVGFSDSALGISTEMWRADRVSFVGQFEGFDHGTANPQGFSALRFAIAAGVGRSRPSYRAGLHLGVGLETAPALERDGEDHTGGSLLLDARAAVNLGPIPVVAITRATYYYDLDCPHSDNKDEVCGEGDHSDFTPRFGAEAELRLGYTPRRLGWQVGGIAAVRYFQTWSRDRTEHGLLVMAGMLAW